MTNPRTGKDLNTKVISTGLAIATGIGVVGLIGWRTAEEASAQDTSPAVSNVDEVVSSTGYTTEQLDAYAAALTQEAERLTEYRNQLNQVANQLAQQSGGAVSVNSKPAKSQPTSKPTGKPTSKPKIAPVPPTQKQQPAPQSNSEGS